MEDFLCINEQAHKMFLWEGNDNKKSFNKHCKEFGKDWYYYDKQISYKYNEKGFREKPLADVDWKNSVVMFGCSYVEGTGNAVEDTIPSILENILGIPVVNLGIGGSSIDVACINSLTLYKHYPKPKAVIQLWTFPYRYANFEEQQPADTIRPNSDNYHLLGWNIRNKYYIDADRELWENKDTIYYDTTMFYDTYKEYGCNYIESIDNARDNIHPGVKSNTLAAETIAEHLQQQGIKKDKLA